MHVKFHGSTPSLRWFLGKKTPKTAILGTFFWDIRTRTWYWVKQAWISVPQGITHISRPNFIGVPGFALFMKLYRDLFLRRKWEPFPSFFDKTLYGIWPPYRCAFIHAMTATIHLALLLVPMLWFYLAISSGRHFPNKAWLEYLTSGWNKLKLLINETIWIWQKVLFHS